MGHNGCDGSQASGPWAIGSGYRFSTKSLAKFRLSPGCEQADHQTLATWLNAEGQEWMKLSVMWSAH